MAKGISYMKFYLVGGAVRDQLLGVPVKERDWVVVGGTERDMLQQGFQRVGKEFPVFLHPKTREEYALARTEQKVEAGYKGFTVEASPTVSLFDDLKRRDLTINAMALDESGELIDPYGGKDDLDKRLLKHVSPAFAEDPVRILRIGRFLARYARLGFHIDPSTIALMKTMVQAGEVDALVAERVFKELDRALGEPSPEQFFQALQACGALSVLFPGITADGISLRALVAATDITPSSAVRFAALMHAYPEGNTSHLNSIRAICNRYRTPTYYHELADIVQKHHETAQNSEQMTKDKVLALFYTLDIFRRPERFDDFLLATEAITRAKEMAWDKQWLKNAGEITRSVDIKPLLQQHLDGAALGDAIRALRLMALNNALDQIQQWQK